MQIRLPRLALLALSFATTDAVAQGPSWRWSESVFWHYGEEPLPQTALGFAGSARLFARRWWDLHVELSALPIMGHERQLVVCASPTGPCDDRQIGPLATADLDIVA